MIYTWYRSGTSNGTGPAPTEFGTLAPNRGVNIITSDHHHLFTSTSTVSSSWGRNLSPTGGPEPRPEAAACSFMMAAITSPRPPQLPSSFSVTLSESSAALRFQLGQVESAKGASWPGYSKTFFFDNSTDGTLRQVANATGGSFSMYSWTLYTSANNSLRVYAKFADDCRPLPLNFTFNQALDLSWLPWSTFSGSTRVGLFKKANLFTYVDHRAPYNYSAAVSKESGRLLYVDAKWTGSLPGTGNISGYTLRSRFEDDWKEGPLPPELFTIPVEGCFQKVPPCPDGKIVVKDVYLAHPHQFSYLDNEDTGDARGDVSFLCPDLLQPGGAAFNQYDAISHWRVEFDTHWGQYQQCNGYPGLCYGLEDFAVGRQVPGGSTELPLSGQCTPNTERGSWFSHTKGGKCAAGQRPAAGVCSWRPVERVKTISLKCLSEQMKSACLADIKAAGGGSPFHSDRWIYNTSLPNFLRAFASDDASAGGCPPQVLSS